MQCHSWMRRLKFTLTKLRQICSLFFTTIFAQAIIKRQKVDAIISKSINAAWNTVKNKRKIEQIKNVSRKMINQNISFKVKVSSPKNKHNNANKP